MADRIDRADHGSHEPLSVTFHLPVFALDAVAADHSVADNAEHSDPERDAEHPRHR